MAGEHQPDFPDLVYIDAWPPSGASPTTFPAAGPGASPRSTDSPLEAFIQPGALTRVSRRGFIKSVVASGATVYALGGISGCVQAAASRAGGLDRLVTLSVNGQSRRVDVLPEETLAMTLRYKLGLTGTKLGCDRAECGACTVMLDGVAHYACSILTHRVRGRSVTTVEGLESPAGDLHPVQQAFIDELAPQCGFCTPGQIMSAVALLSANPNPTRDQARRAMSGNLCRCGAYDHYLEGVMTAAAAMNGTAEAAAALSTGASGAGPDVADAASNANGRG